MDKRDFLNFLEFPPEWLELELYPDILFDIQLKAIMNDLSERNEEKKMLETKYGGGAEHYRYGAFWWVIKNMSPSVLDNLKVVAEKDPDTTGVRRAMLKDIHLLLQNNVRG